MLIAELASRGFRNLADETRLDLVPGLTLITGANGAGKTNILEAAFVALTGGSPRTNRLREVVGFGKQAARATAVLKAADGVQHEIVTAIGSSGERRRSLDGAPLAEESVDRPAVVVFMPDRLGLIKGPPAGRRAHLDQLATVLQPAFAGTRRAYGAALAQRNALLGAIRAGRAGAGALEAWNETLAEAGAGVVAGRQAAADLVAGPFSRWASELGLSGDATLEYRPRVACAGEPAALRAALEDRAGTDVERGHTTTGPHHDELALSRDERALRRYGSQGEQRLTLLALLLAEREVVGSRTGRAPLALFDDVMSELDPGRRRLLASGLAGEGQALVTTTEAEHVPSEAPVAGSWLVEAGVASRL